MGKYKIIIPESVKKQISSHNKSGDKSIIKKIEKILIELETLHTQALVIQNNLNTILPAFGPEG